MAKRKQRAAGAENSGATVGYEAQLWQMSNALRGSMDAAEYKHVVLGLIFIKYISDAFEEQHGRLVADTKGGADPEDPDEYRAHSIFWVPPEARRSHLKTQARQPAVGRLVDDAMAGVERDNRAVKGVLSRDYARPALDKTRLGQLIDMVSNVRVGDEEARAKDVLGRVYEYFLSQFASAEGKKGGEFYTLRRVVLLLVEMPEPYRGRAYDPCCESSGMFVQSIEFIRAHANGNGDGGKAAAVAKPDISIYGQESNYTTWRLAKMNLAIRGIDGQIAHGHTFHEDHHPDLKADFILANPPFNVSDWGGERLRDDKRWKYGAPPSANANFAWVQHMVHHLAPTGVAGFVLSNSSMSSNQSGEGEIRKAVVEADLVDCMVALPGQLFYSTPIASCLWFLARDRGRTQRELTNEDIARIAATYHAWRGEKDAGEYADVPGFCKSATLEEVRTHGHVLTPGRYVGAEAQEEDGEAFEEKMKRLTATLRLQQAEAAKLDAAITANLKELGFGGKEVRHTSRARRVAHLPLPRREGDARRGPCRTLRSRDPSPRPGRQVQHRALSRGLHVPAQPEGVRFLEITNRDLKDRAWSAQEVPTLRFHRAGSGHALRPPPQRACRSRQRRDHARLCSPAPNALRQRRALTQARCSRAQVRRAVQGGLRRDPCPHEGRREAEAEDRVLGGEGVGACVHMGKRRCG
jgi:type I restriction enzyme M protein